MAAGPLDHTGPEDPHDRSGAPADPVYSLPPDHGVRDTTPETDDDRVGPTRPQADQLGPPAGRGAPRGPWAARTGPGEDSLTRGLGGSRDHAPAPSGAQRPVPGPTPRAAPGPFAVPNPNPTVPPPPTPTAGPDRVPRAPDDRGPVSATPSEPARSHRSAERDDPRLRDPGVTGEPVRVPLPAPTGDPAPLGSDTLLRSRRHAAPLTGWRRALKAITFGTVEPGPSPAQIRLAERTAAIRVPIVGTHRVAVISLKGGVGKTTTTMMLGSTLASLRGDRVIALDANPDAGTLGDRLPRRTTATVRDLLTHYTEVRSWADLAAYTSQSSSRLEVIANDVDPSVSTAVTAADYLRIVEMLGRYYSVVLTDSGTGLLHDAMNGILNAADTLVLVSSASVDGARSASTTLDWLDAQGYGHLVRSAVTVVSSVRPGGREVNVDAIASYFASRCRAVVRIPFDPHLETGAETDLDALAPSTRDAYIDLAVAVAGDFDRGDEQARARRRGRPHST